MNRDRYQQVTKVFQHACSLDEPARSEYLHQACADDPPLREEVERMLAGDDDETFLETPYVQRVEDDSTIVQVGEYKVSGEIGRGGMGVVLRAEQVSPRRDIALKLISPELSSSAAAGRLSREAELLGRLRHPGIAQIYEAGRARVTDSHGRTHEQPFIAMELVDGVALTQYVNEHTLNRRTRLELLAEIADAVQHAHQRGVAHLDLKPLNILVEDSGHARVLDFGVARVLDAADDAITQGRAIAGTLAYMAPEQLTGRDADIDTRADVFALGALGFELLTGALPRDIDDQDPADAIHAMLVTPARRLSEADPSVDRELEAVIHKAIDPNRDHRYASAAEFAADIRRYLRSVPVEARRGGWGRSTTLFMRRHRPLVVATVVAVVALAGGVVALALGLVRAHASAEDAKAAQIAADAEAANAGRMAAFLQSTIFGVDPEELGPQATFFDALEDAARPVNRDLADYPEVEADVRFSLGFVYRRHAMFDKAMDHIRAAARLRRQVHGEDHPKTLEAIEEVAYLSFLVDGDGEQAEIQFRRILALQQRAGRAQSENAGWQQLKLGVVLIAQDRLNEAVEPLDHAARILGRHYGAPYTARPLAWRATIALDGGDAEAAKAIVGDALALIEGVDEQEYIKARLHLVHLRVLVAEGRLDEARAQLDTVFEEFTRLLPSEHVELADAHEVAAELALRLEDTSFATLHASHCLRMREHMLDPEHPSLLWAQALMVLAAIAPDDPGAALAELDRLFLRLDAVVGADHRLSLQVLEAALRCAERTGEPIAIERKQEMLERLRARRASRLRDAKG